MNGQYLFELTLSGLTRGSIYALVALGYTMVYGILGLINFAHGEVYMLSAFVGLAAAGVCSILGLGAASMLILAVLFAMAWGAAYGYSIEQVAYRPLRGQGRLTPLISAIGMSIFLRETVILAQGPDFVSFPALIFEVAQFDFLSQYIAPSELVITVTALLVLAGLFVLLQTSKTGKAMRAIAQDRAMAQLLGVQVDRVISMTFILGSALAAVAAILISAHTGQINYNIGFIVGIKAFTAAVLGGIGSIPGAALGGLVLGLAEAFAAGYVSSDYEDLFAFGILVLILLVRPAGLLGNSTPEKA